MSLAWKLHRLVAMTPEEVARRAAAAVIDRLAPPDYARASPAAAYDLLFEGDAAATLGNCRLKPAVGVADASAFAPAIAEADALARGAWTLFGKPVRLADPPAWSRNPLLMHEWPEAPSRAIDYRQHGLGGAKYVWELGRLTVLPTLAIAASITGDRSHADRALAWLDDFVARHPLGRGIHHTSGIEMAIRSLTIPWALAILGERVDPARARAALGLVAQQALHCRDHPSVGSSANNHLIAEYAAMAVVGGAYPSLRGGGALLAAGMTGLTREVERQIHPDGVPAEQAFGYLPFVWELLLLSFVAAEAAGVRVPEETRERLAVSLEFARTIRLPGGRWPQIGDEDDGRILLASEGWSRLDLVGNALAAFLEADGLSEEDAYARLVVGRGARARAATDGRHEFPRGGYTVWRDRGVLVTFDHGPLGLGRLAAHGHADALSVTIFRGADAVVLDPGTFAYHDDLPARERCRSTPYHATVHFGGRSQAESLGPFLWGGRATVTGNTVPAECQWPDGEYHTRRVEVAGDRIVVEDQVRGSAPTLVFPLHPEARPTLEGGRAIVEVGGTAAVFETSGCGPWSLEPGEYAPRFGTRLPAPRLTAPITGARCRTEIRLSDRTR